MRAAGTPDELHARRPEPDRPSERPPMQLGERHRRWLVAAQGVPLGAAIAAAVLLSDASQWTPVELVGLLAVPVVGRGLLTLEAKRVPIPGSVLRPVLALALPGSGPAGAMRLPC